MTAATGTQVICFWLLLKNIWGRFHDSTVNVVLSRVWITRGCTPVWSSSVVINFCLRFKNIICFILASYWQVLFNSLWSRLGRKCVRATFLTSTMATVATLHEKLGEVIEVMVVLALACSSVANLHLVHTLEHAEVPPHSPNTPLHQLARSSDKTRVDVLKKWMD